MFIVSDFAAFTIPFSIDNLFGIIASFAVVGYLLCLVEGIIAAIAGRPLHLKSIRIGLLASTSLFALTVILQEIDLGMGISIINIAEVYSPIFLTIVFWMLPKGEKPIQKAIQPE